MLGTLTVARAVRGVGLELVVAFKAVLLGLGLVPGTAHASLADLPAHVGAGLVVGLSQ